MPMIEVEDDPPSPAPHPPSGRARSAQVRLTEAPPDGSYRRMHLSSLLIDFLSENSFSHTGHWKASRAFSEQRVPWLRSQPRHDRRASTARLKQEGSPDIGTYSGQVGCTSKDPRCPPGHSFPCSTAARHFRSQPSG